MSLLDRADSLRVKHASLDAALKDEARRPRLDDRAVAEIKRKKLKIKDELERITH